MKRRIRASVGDADRLPGEVQNGGASMNKTNDVSENASATEPAHASQAECCSRDEQASCCEPAAKAGCCGSARAQNTPAPSACGCR
jgi:hypothetical protein